MKKNGFTLVELLAVIIILALLSLVLTPIVTGIIKDARERTDIYSVEAHIENVNNSLLLNSGVLFTSEKLTGTYTFEGLNLTGFPSDDSIRCGSYDVEQNVVVSASNCTIKEKNYCYANKKASTCENVIAADDINALSLNKINQIRQTSNTNIGNRTGSIYYVSGEGDDSNDGLSESTPFKTLQKLRALFDHHDIADNSTILFRDGDIFRGSIIVKANNIMFGSYGDISKGKPKIYVSPYDGAKEGTWVEVKTNIWKYTYEDSDQVFDEDIGTMWFFCNEGNNNCNDSMPSISRKFEYAIKKTTSKTYDESNIEDNIDTLITNDLEFYHAGHAANKDGATGGALYLYSTSNPSQRFDEIEFNKGKNAIYLDSSKGVKSAYIDNINFAFTGNHAVRSDTISNLKVTNCEIGFIGGSVQNYDSGEAARYGSGIEVYGSIISQTDNPVTDGFTVDNNYIYQVYDTGLTFQYSTTSSSIIEKAYFKNNVIEYCNYSIEYWNRTKSLDQSVRDQTYIADYVIDNNIMRYSGMGISSTRPDRGESAHIKTWSHDDWYNVVSGKFEIKNNIFDTSIDQFFSIYAQTSDDLPTLTGNTLYGDSADSFGDYYYLGKTKREMSYDKYLLNIYFPNNRFVVRNDDNFTDDSGQTGDVTWEYIAQTGLLKISGTGAMADYTLESLPPWYQYKDKIYKIEIGENVTALGKYAFYEFTNVVEVRIDSILLADLAQLDNNTGDNYTFVKIGVNTEGAAFIFGPKVTYIPRFLTKPDDQTTSYSNFNSLTFEGTNITELIKYGLTGFTLPAYKVPDHITKIGTMGLNRFSEMKFMVMSKNLTEISSYGMAYHNKLEKLVFPSGIKKIGDYGFAKYYALKTLVIPSISSSSATGKNTFEKMTNVVDIYGDSSVKTWLDAIKSQSGQTNLIYHPLSEYTSTVRSNTGINETINYNGTYTFTTDKNVTIVMYYQDSNGLYYTVDADYTKEGNTYTITNIVSDIDIMITD